MPLKVSDGIGAWIKDFQKSDAPQFKGQSAKERQTQAVAAYLSAKRGPLKKENVKSADRKPEVYTKPDGKRGVRMVPADKAVVKMDELKYTTMNKYMDKAKKSKDRATNSAVATILRKGDHSKDLQTMKKRDKGMAMAKSRTVDKIRKGMKEDMTFKVEVEGLPALFIAGNSPGQVKNHLRKLIKQPSMIKSVERQTKYDVKKMYRKKAQGKDIEEAVDSTDTGGAEEVNMAMKQIKAMKHFLDGIEARVKSTGDMEEWYQNKLTKANDYLKTLYSYGKGDIDENTINELSPDTVKSYKKAASKSNYSAAQKYARVAASPTGRKYKNKEMGKQDDIMRKRKAGLAMADKKKVDEQLDERTPIKPVVVDRKQKNLKVPNPNYKGPLKRKEKKQRDLYKEGSCGEVDYGSDKSIKIMKKKTPGETNEKITLAKVRGALYKTAKAMGDVQAVRKKKVGKRVARRVAGKAASKVLRNLIR